MSENKQIIKTVGPLFKVDSKDELRSWRAEAYDTGEYCFFSTNALGTVVPQLRIAQGKNLGRSNETSSQEQAILLIESAYRKKIREGYKNDRDEAIRLKGTDGEGRMRAMTVRHFRLSTFDKKSREYTNSRTPKYPGTAQLKEDGVCAMLSDLHGLSTRGGKDTLTPGGATLNELCPQIVDTWRQLMRMPEVQQVWDQLCKEHNMVSFQLSTTYFHGELCYYQDIMKQGDDYYRPYILDEITSFVKKECPQSKLMQLRIFDIALTSDKWKWRDQYLSLFYTLLKRCVPTACMSHELDKRMSTYTPFTVSVSLGEVTCEKDFLELYDKWVVNGQEGMIYRHYENMYTPGDKSNTVQKLVYFDSSEYLITGVIAMEKYPDQGLFVCAMPDGHTAKEDFFYVTPSGTHERRLQILQNPQDYIGKMLTLRHRGFTTFGTPRIASEPENAIRSVTE